MILMAETEAAGNKWPLGAAHCGGRSRVVAQFRPPDPIRKLARNGRPAASWEREKWPGNGAQQVSIISCVH